jgi:regulator of protease activity HflC (stomatin/prohibitin superfamily)
MRIFLRIVYALLILGIPLLTYWILFQKLFPNNYFFGYIGEATGRHLMRGNHVKDTQIQMRGRKLNPDGKIEPRTGKEPKVGPLGRLVWLGIPPIGHFHEYKLKVPKLTIVRDDQGNVTAEYTKIITMDLTAVSLKDHTYHLRVVDAEDIDGLHLDVWFTVVMTVVHPYKAVFQAEQWVTKTLDVIEAEARNVITQKKYQEWQNDSKDMSIEIRRRIAESNEGNGVITNFQQIEDRWGTEVLSLQLRRIDPPKAFRDLTLAKWQAERNAEAAIVKAKADAEVLGIGAEAEALKKVELAMARVDEISLVYGETATHGELGQLLASLEALSGEKGQGIATIEFIPGLKDAVGGLMSSGTATHQEMGALKGMLIDLSKKVEQVLGGGTA